MPSSRRQICASAAARVVREREVGLHRCARSTKRLDRRVLREALERRHEPSSRAATAGARGRPTSPGRPSASRLLGRTRPPGSRAAACPRDARTRQSGARSCRGAAAPAWDGDGRPASRAAGGPRLLAHAERRGKHWGTRAGSARCANSTSHTPSGYSLSRRAPISRERRVLPLPPGPVIVSRCVSASSASPPPSRVRAR